jgi:small subunit ribosomal protein S13
MFIAKKNVSIIKDKDKITYMVRIGNKEMPDSKNIRVALSYIYGLGKNFGLVSPSRKILKELNINPFIKVRDLTSEQINLISQRVKNILTEGELKEKIQKGISEQIRLGTYRGLRRVKKLPVNGQRTRHNAQTAKKGGAATRKKIAVAGKKKAPTPK